MRSVSPSVNSTGDYGRRSICRAASAIVSQCRSELGIARFRMDRRPDHAGLRTLPNDDLAPRQPRLGQFEFGDHLLHDVCDRSSSNQERPDDRDPGRQGEAVPHPARGARRVCHRQCVGRRFGPDDGSAGLRGAGDLKRRIRGFARSARRPGHARERIAAAAATARALPFPFTLTGRTENFLRGRPDLDDTITRLKAYEAAGADALMAPGLPDLEAVRAVCVATEKPFNFMVGIKGKSFTVAALAAAGVKRISLATSLYRAAMTGLLNAAKEVREHGTFGYIDASLATPEMNAFLRE